MVMTVVVMVIMVMTVVTAVIVVMGMAVKSDKWIVHAGCCALFLVVVNIR